MLDADSTLLRIGQIAVPVTDLERAITFYRDALGLTFLFRAPPGLAFFDCGGVRLMLGRPEGSSERSQGGSSTTSWRISRLPTPRSARAARRFSTRRISSRDCPTTSSGWRSATTRRAIFWG